MGFVVLWCCMVSTLQTEFHVHSAAKTANLPTEVSHHLCPCCHQHCCACRFVCICPVSHHITAVHAYAYALSHSTTLLSPPPPFLTLLCTHMLPVLLLPHAQAAPDTPWEPHKAHGVHTCRLISTISSVVSLRSLNEGCFLASSRYAAWYLPAQVIECGG